MLWHCHVAGKGQSQEMRIALGWPSARKWGPQSVLSMTTNWILPTAMWARGRSPGFREEPSLADSLIQSPETLSKEPSFLPQGNWNMIMHFTELLSLWWWVTQQDQMNTVRPALSIPFTFSACPFYVYINFLPVSFFHDGPVNFKMLWFPPPRRKAQDPNLANLMFLPGNLNLEKNDKGLDMIKVIHYSDVTQNSPLPVLLESPCFLSLPVSLVQLSLWASPDSSNEFLCCLNWVWFSLLQPKDSNWYIEPCHNLLEPSFSSLGYVMVFFLKDPSHHSWLLTVLSPKHPGVQENSDHWNGRILQSEAWKGYIKTVKLSS